MKKILSILLSASMLITSAALPAFAENDNDIELLAVGDAYSAFAAGANDVDNVVNYTYDDGTETNGLDNSKAAKNGSTPAVTSSTQVSAFSPYEIFDITGKGTLTQDFFLTIDVRFDTVDGKVPGHLTFKNGSSIKTKDNVPYESYDVGPDIYLENGTLKNTKAKDLATGLSADTWYRLEFEGKTKGSDPCVNFRIYGMKEGTLQCLGEASQIGLRNYESGSTKKDLVILRGTNVSYDNVRLVLEYPDEIRPTATLDSIKAGVDRTTLTPVFYRNNTAMTTTYTTTWEAYRGGTKIEDKTVTIKDGILETTEDAAPGKITVKASSVVREGVTVTGEKEITIEGVDISDESFHEITLNGDDTIKAGGASKTYTFTAKKNGQAVDITNANIDWRIYDSSGKNRIQSKNITIKDGVLTVADGVIAQNICVAAYSKPDGYRNGTYPVSIQFSENQTETVLGSTACETAIDADTEVVQSIDGSGAYKMIRGKELASFGKTGDYVYTEFDANMTDVANNGDIVIYGGENTPFTLRKNSNKLSTFNGSSYGATSAIENDKWYHVGILFSGEKKTASMSVAEYDSETGELGEAKIYTDLATRNANKTQKYGSFTIGAGVIIDNLKITTPIPEATLTPQKTVMYAGDTNKMTISFTKNGLPIDQSYEVSWYVTDTAGEALTGDAVTVANGVLSAMATAQDQRVKVAAYIGTEKVAETSTIEIKSAEIFEMVKIGISYENDNVIDKVYVNKKLFYEDDVTILMAFYDDNDALIGVRTYKTYGKNLSVGVNPVTVNWDIPEGFDTTKGKASVFIWTSL